LLKSRARWKFVDPELLSLRSQVFFCSLSFKKPPFSKKRGLKFWKKVSRFTRDLRRASIRRRGKKRNQRNKRALCFRLRLFLPLKIDANVANAFETSRFLRLFFASEARISSRDFFPLCVCEGNSPVDLSYKKLLCRIFVTIKKKFARVPFSQWWTLKRAFSPEHR